VPPGSQDQAINQDKISSQDQVDTQDGEDISWVEDGDMVVVATKTPGELLIPVEDHFKDINGSEAVTEDSTDDDGKEDKPRIIKTLTKKVGSMTFSSELAGWFYFIIN